MGAEVQKKKNKMCLFHSPASTFPHSFRVSVSIISKILPTINLSKFCQKFCRQCQLRTLNRCVRLRPYGFTRKHDRRGPNGQLPCILDQQRPPRTLRDHVQSASALSALKKSLVANLSAKRQLSVAKPSAKRNVSLAKRDFLVANGRMAADFSSPVLQNHKL